MSDQVFVPGDFAVPDGFTATEFQLEPLGPQHNAADYAAWTTSIDHIRATPGFAGSSWPHEMSPADNLRDLQRHAQDFAERRGFTYTVLSAGTGDVIGCVYIYPPRVAPGAKAGRSCVPGSGRTAPRWTPPFTTRSWHGCSTTGRSGRSSMRHEDDRVSAPRKHELPDPYRSLQASRRPRHRAGRRIGRQPGLPRGTPRDPLRREESCGG